MKTILESSNYTFIPSSNQVDFGTMSTFNQSKLLAIINVTTGKLVYSTSGTDSGFGGSFSGNVLTYASSNAGQNTSDILQVIYEDPTASQVVVGSYGSEATLKSALHDGSGTYPILSTPDPVTLRDGLDINIQSASVMGLLNNPLPMPYSNQALSVGYINGGDLVTPAMNTGTNELIVDATQSGNIPVNIAAQTGAITVDIGSSLTALDVNLQSSAVTLPVSIASTVAVSAASLPLPVGASTESTLSAMSAKLPATLGSKTIANSMAVNVASDQIIPVSQNEQYTAGALTLALGNNIFQQSVSANSTDAQGFKTGSVQIVTSATTGALIFEHSNDNINFQSMPVFRADSASPNVIVGAFTPVASSFIYHFPIKARYIRCRISTVLNQNAQAYLRLSQESWSPIVNQVINSTAANLNATVSGSLTSVGTVTTVSGVTTVSSVTSSGLASAQVTDITSAAIAVTSTSANISTTNTQAASFGVYVTAISGSGAAMDVTIQETMNGTDYYTIYQFERITATGQYYSPAIKLSGSGIRYVRTISGTTPSVTNSVIRVSRSGQAETIRRFINRTIDLNTLNSITGSFLCEGVEDFNLMVRCTAQTTPATVALEFSMDNTNWFTSTATVATIAGIAQVKTNNEQWKFVRANVTSAGTGITLGEVIIGGHSA